MRRVVTQHKTPVLLHAVAVVAMCSLLISGCSDTSEGAEAELRRWVAEGQSLAEEKERRALIQRISPGFTGSMGYSRDDLNKFLRVLFLRQNSIALLVSIEDMRIFGDSAAEIDLKVGMAGTNDRFLGFSADAYRFELELQKQGDDWMLISAYWGALGEELQ